MLIAIILASGKGTRLAPLSTPSRPKQYLSLVTNETLVEDTVNRVRNFIEPNNIFVVTNIDHKDLALSIFKDLPQENIILEPQMKETLASISHAFSYISKIKGDNFKAVVLPSDHYIDDNVEFENSIKEGLEVLNNNYNHVLYGVKPTNPSTEYGYLETTNGTKDLIVTNFIEKPAQDIANQLFSKDNYYWNNAIMITTKELLFNSIKDILPEQYQLLEDLTNNTITTNDYFNNTLVANFSRSILEKQSNMNFVNAKYLWYDVGGFDSLFELLEKLGRTEKLNTLKKEIEKTVNHQK